ncbi:MAG: hypothetical protein U0353_13260 [Sandaracinus sp.]
MTRTALGRGVQQRHSFACPTCGVGITYVMNLDQEKVDFSYEDDVTNGRWLVAEDGSTHEAVFDPEVLGLRPNISRIEHPLNSDGGPPMRMSPFMETALRFRDYERFRVEQTKRFQALQKNSHVQRALTHFGRSNWALFAKEIATLGGSVPTAQPSGRVLALRAALVDHQESLLLPERAFSTTMFDLYSRALATSPAAVDDFAEELRAGKRLRALWTQIVEVRVKSIDNALYTMPLLQARLWRDAPDLDQCIVYDKHFDGLKQLYIESFELLANLSTLLLALWRILAAGSTSVPTNGGSMSIWQYDGMANAGKPHHLQPALGGTVVAAHLDTRVRNGIGHHSAHYDAASDSVVYYSPQGALLQETRESYTRFVALLT